MLNRTTDGILLVDKPAGVTSHDVVHTLRRALGAQRVGHAGTLDPFATGLLVLLIGRVTRLAQYVDGDPKVYSASIRFGAETDTDDVTGGITRESALPDPARVRDAIAALTGEIMQVPPDYSAKQVEGQRAYAAARRGAPMQLQPTRVRVDGWTVHALSSTQMDVTITCGGGTYIRALARDVGRLAGSAAHLLSLRRLRSGPFDVADAAPLEMLARVGVRPLLRPALDAMRGLAVEPLDAPALARVARGMTVPASVAGERAALVDEARELVAIAERRGVAWQPRVVLRDA